MQLTQIFYGNSMCNKLVQIRLHSGTILGIDKIVCGIPQCDWLLKQTKQRLREMFNIQTKVLHPP